nr:hypothetical protein BaRGS_034608 [Batillaria attramentaria]
MHADVVQLRQHIKEINTNLGRLDDVTSDLQLEVTGLTSGQQKMHEEIKKLRLADRDLDKVISVKVNMSRMEAEATATKNSLRDVVKTVQERIDNIEARLNASVPVEDVLTRMANETSRLDSELSKRDETVAQLQEDYDQLGAVVSRLTDQMASMRLREFMERLQRSLVNFTSNVLTLDQWQAASQQMVSATQRTEERLSDLATRVLDNTKLGSDLQFSVRDYQLLGERQYRVLQSHIIRLNNTLQDLEETVSQLASKQFLVFQSNVGSYGGINKHDCDDYYSRGYSRTGDYIIYPKNADHSVKVRCIMHNNSNNNNRKKKKGNDDRKKKNNDYSDKNDVDDADEISDGGWTVIQQRNSGKVNFTRSWAEYAVGFGSTHSEYWLGNELIHLMTSQRNYTLVITMRDIFGGHWLATYATFTLASKDDSYRLTLSGYRGNATDTFNYSAGMTFSTYDRDTDLSSSPCARYNGGGWWYSHCQISNLNGPYDIGMIWFQRDWRDWLQLREVVMMIKPRT